MTSEGWWDGSIRHDGRGRDVVLVKLIRKLQVLGLEAGLCKRLAFCASGAEALPEVARSHT